MATDLPSSRISPPSPFRPQPSACISSFTVIAPSAESAIVPPCALVPLTLTVAPTTMSVLAETSMVPPSAVPVSEALASMASFSATFPPVLTSRIAPPGESVWTPFALMPYAPPLLIMMSPAASTVTDPAPSSALALMPPSTTRFPVR
jgi:hypothetical protein